MIARLLHFFMVAMAALALLLSLTGARAADLEPPSGPPAATIDLATPEGIQLVKGAWRYSDTRVVEVPFRKAGADGQPTGETTRTYDIAPHAGGAAYDDSGWETIAPNTLDQRRGSGRLSFNWYRLRLKI